MRAIEVEPGLSVRFPGRSADFAEGVEVGILSILMAQGAPDISREVPNACVDQVSVLAVKLGYRMSREGGEDGRSWITLRPRGMRPSLRIVSSR